MKAIIVAAGRGKRLGPHTDEIPKCMVPVAGRPILAHQLAAFAGVGVTDIIIVRGYRGDRIIAPGARFYDNPDFARNNILASLFYAAEELDEQFLFSYADIVYTEAVVRTLLETQGEDVLVVDREWTRIYEGRTEHPMSEAELTQVVEGRVVKVGKRLVAQADAVGEFIGLARFSGATARRMRTEFERLWTEGPARPFGSAPKLEVAYLTDMLNHLIETDGATFRPAYIHGGWREIDTGQDLAAAQALFQAESTVRNT